MKKILSLSLTLIMLAMLFSGCGVFGSKGVSVGEFYANYTEEPAWLYQTATNITELAEKTTATSIGYASDSSLIALSDVGEAKTDIIVYSLEKNQNVHTFTINNEDIYTIEFMNIFGNDFFTVIHGVKRTDGFDFSTTLYSKNGEQIARAKGIHAYSGSSLGEALKLDFSITCEANLIRFDKTIFKVSEDGAATILKEKNNFMLDLPDVDFYNGTYYITETDASFVVYDTNLEFVSNWKYKFADHDGIDYDYFILSDGTILFQSFETLPEDAKDYDFCEDGKKIKVETVLIDPKKGTEKSANISFVIHESIALDELGGNETYSKIAGISEKYKNIASISYIEDKKMTTSAVVALSNNGKVTDELFTDLPMIEEGSIPQVFSNNIFYYYTINGTYMFINAENEKIIELGTSAFSNMKANNSYIIVDGVIYDYSFRVVYDFGSENYKLYSDDHWYTKAIMSEGILLTRDGAVYLYKNGATNLILSKDSTDKFDTATDDIYVIKREGNSGDDRYVHFNARGQELFTSFGYAGSLVLSDSELGIALFCAFNSDGQITYYRLSK